MLEKMQVSALLIANMDHGATERSISGSLGSIPQVQKGSSALQKECATPPSSVTHGCGGGGARAIHKQRIYISHDVHVEHFSYTLGQWRECPRGMPKRNGCDIRSSSIRDRVSECCTTCNASHSSCRDNDQQHVTLYLLTNRHISSIIYNTNAYYVKSTFLCTSCN